jgi:hypothetical protein
VPKKIQTVPQKRKTPCLSICAQKNSTCTKKNSICASK